MQTIGKIILNQKPSDEIRSYLWMSESVTSALYPDHLYVEMNTEQFLRLIKEVLFMKHYGKWPLGLTIKWKQLEDECYAW